MNYIDDVVGAHELAHAMAGQEMGLEIEKVHVYRTLWSGNMLGVCYPASQLIPVAEGHDDKPDERVCQAILTEIAAGQAAVEMWYEQFRPRDAVPWTAAYDKPLHRKELRRMGDWGVRLRSWDESMADARTALEPIWPLLLERIPLLLSRKTLRQKHVRISKKPGLPSKKSGLRRV